MLMKDMVGLHVVVSGGKCSTAWSVSGCCKTTAAGHDLVTSTAPWNWGSADRMLMG